MKHAQSPWIEISDRLASGWESARHFHSPSNRDSGGSGCVAVVYANQPEAQLMLHAPDLLAALESCMDAIRRLAKESPDGVPMWASDAHDAARKAIDKATN